RSTYALAAVLLPAGVSLGLFVSYAEQGKAVEVIAVHPNLDCRKERKTYSADTLIKVHWRLTQKYLRDSTRYILWPENSFNMGWLEELAVNPQLAALRDSLKNYPNAQLITGTISYERYQPGDLDQIPANTRYLEVKQQKIWYNTYNSALQLNAGPAVLFRTKIHLVPLEETTVYPVVINFMRKFIASLGGDTFSTRPVNQHLFHNQEVVAPLICYELFFGNTVRKFVNQGANLLFVILNEGWIDDDKQAAQFMQYTSLRAIENRRSIVRSSNKGITCFIDQRGIVTQAFADNAATSLTGKAKLNRKKTFYTMTGDYIGWLSALVFATYLAGLPIAFVRMMVKSNAKKVLLKRAV
ncbi:MAG: apolipoprotein N-acyltransferase, partial [Cytophagales bacterium]|nr:apolipoprotein N-acyltransferase [Cytophagales bacterium]